MSFAGLSARQLGAQLEEKRTQLANLFDSIKTEDGDGYDRSKNPQVIDEIRKRNEDLAELGKAYDDARALEKTASENASELKRLREVPDPLIVSAKGSDGSRVAPLSLGEMVCKHLYGNATTCVDVKNAPGWNRDRDVPFDVASFKTTMTTAAGWGPENLRSGKVQLSAQRPIRLFDIVPMIPLSTGNAYVYMEETTFTNNAAEIAENDGTGAAESALALTEQSATIRNVTTFLPVTDEQLADVPGVQSYVDQRLGYMIRAKVESQLLAGNGVAPALNGYYTQVTQAQALGSDTKYDAIFKAMVKVRHTGFAEPDAVVIHPNDWQDFRLTRTTDGIYIMGNPADVGASRLFGVNVVETTAATENTALVGDFAGHSAMVYRGGLQIKVSDSHSDYFIKFKQAIRANLRCALVVYRIAAFCEVTGL